MEVDAAQTVQTAPAYSLDNGGSDLLPVHKHDEDQSENTESLRHVVAAAAVFDLMPR